MNGFTLSSHMHSCTRTPSLPTTTPSHPQKGSCRSLLPAIKPAVRRHLSPTISSNNSQKSNARQKAWACHAEPDAKADKAPNLNIMNITSALTQAQKAWENYDHDKSGSLSLTEAVDLLNSPEVRRAIMIVTNVEPLTRSEEDIRKLYEKADADHSGGLSRQEFLGLYIALVKERVQASPLVLAEALLGFIDVDRNGKIEGGELKVLLAMLGFPAAILLPIPNFIGIDYRGILKTLSGRA